MIVKPKDLMVGNMYKTHGAMHGFTEHGGLRLLEDGEFVIYLGMLSAEDNTAMPESELQLDAIWVRIKLLHKTHVIYYSAHLKHELGLLHIV